MYAIIINGVVETYPYSIGQLLRDNPQTSFPKNPTDSLLAEYNVLPVQRTDYPAYDLITQNLTEQTPVLAGNVWVQDWLVSPATEEQVSQRLAERLATLKMERAEAYRAEADPLFFKAQRGEASMDEWTIKVEEIRARYPYPSVAG